MGVVFASRNLKKHIATLSKALESVSTNLSIAALLGLALIPLVPDRAASTYTNHTAPPPAVAPAAASAPIEVIRAKPVLVPEMPLPADMALQAPPTAKIPSPDPAPAAVPQAGAPLRLAKLSRDRRRRSPRGPEPQSGDLGKTAFNAPAAKTPVTPPDAKSAKTEPPEPDSWSDREIIAALQDCLKRLAPLGAEVEIAPPVRQEQCGAPAPVLLKRLGRVEFQPAPMLNCAMVASLHTWIEKTLQPAAQDVLGSPVTRVRGAAGYACRNRLGSAKHSDRLSEHALANAIDIMGFVTADGRTIDVETKWGPNARDIREQHERSAEATALAKRAEDEAKAAAKQAEREAAEAARAAKRVKGKKQEDAKAEAARKKTEADRKREEADQKEAARLRSSLRTAELQKLGRGLDPKTDAKTDAKAIPSTAKAAGIPGLAVEAVFLRRLHKGACTAFGTVLGPDANEAHRNHFHFDLAPRRRSAFCE